MKNDFQQRISLSKKILEQDKYGDPISFNYVDGSPVFKTGFGAFLSLFVSILTFIYFANNLYVMFNFKGSRFSAFIAD